MVFNLRSVVYTVGFLKLMTKNHSSILYSLCYST
nr:MAG TPA: hypothetical protein [Caudoviricetes sp.]